MKKDRGVTKLQILGAAFAVSVLASAWWIVAIETASWMIGLFKGS